MEIYLVSRQWVVALAMVLSVTQASAATIVIDGSFADWSSIPVTATDPAGDSAFSGRSRSFSLFAWSTIPPICMR